MREVSSELLLDLYGAADDPARWTPFLDRVCRDLGVGNAVIQCLRQSGDRLDEMWCARDTVSTARRELHDRLVNNAANPRMNLAIDRSPKTKRLIRDADRFDPACPHYAALRRRLHEAGLGDALCLGIGDGKTRMYSLLVHQDATRERGFEQADEAYLMALFPHVEQALSIGERRMGLEGETAALRRVLDSLRIGVVFSECGREVTWANESALEMMRLSPHLCGVGRQSLIPRFGAGEAVTRQPRQGSPRATVLGSGEPDELQVLALPLKDGEGPGGIALLLVEPRRTPAIAPEELAPLLGITRSEARLAGWLAGGGTIKDYACQRGLSEGSVRNQAKQALFKSGAPRQADLVRHVCGSLPGLLRGSIAQVMQ